MAKAKKGDKVRINYTGKLEDGTVFDSTLEDSGCETGEHTSEECGCGCGGGPEDMIIGEGDFFPQIDETLVGMAPGEKRTVIIKAEDAFGEYDSDRVFTVPRSELPEDLVPQAGDELVLTDEDDEDLEVMVVEVNEESITFDANHPLAGEDLYYEIELTEIL
jgi:peptidylprolyl isomerase